MLRQSIFATRRMGSELGELSVDTSMSDLPNELIVDLLGGLASEQTAMSLLDCRATCRAWQRAVDQMWERPLLTDFLKNWELWFADSPDAAKLVNQRCGGQMQSPMRRYFYARRLVRGPTQRRVEAVFMLGQVQPGRDMRTFRLPDVLRILFAFDPTEEDIRLIVERLDWDGSGWLRASDMVRWLLEPDCWLTEASISLRPPSWASLC